MRFLLPILVAVLLAAVAAVAVYAVRRRARRHWASRSISGGRKALILNLLERR